ncbi:MAG: hypothetical protein BWY73_01039 [candidate division TA06 bacterium ADurb.Bin417]|uniref:Uncharacterized protein n=1 Tax=candidate division TA06 bacterium ADurb.Bin417 TaxID=1852828 RepID=A0A1V5MEG8_UNCT6|nr:MAG: hypothetical protein BWY73_01039 [candidate division TA06 bacterium ADurb.Bin417]
MSKASLKLPSFINRAARSRSAGFPRWPKALIVKKVPAAITASTINVTAILDLGMICSFLELRGPVERCSGGLSRFPILPAVRLSH